ncbi:MAG: hypothetical protein ACYDG5_00630 [Dehalococcoidales bacterium]
MTKLLIKIMPAALICLLLALLFLPAVSVYAQDGYSLTIIKPTNGATIDTTDFDLSISWVKPSATWAINMHVEIKLITLADSGSGQDAWFDQKLEFGSGAYLQDSGTWTWHLYFETAWDLGKAPAGEYEVKAIIQDSTVGGNIVATAVSSFYYKASPEIQPIELPVIDTFQSDRDVVVTGHPFNLTWKVTGATSLSISQGIGTVGASGTKSITPTATAEYTLTAANLVGNVQKTITVNVAVDELDAVLFLYQRLNFTGCDYGFGPGNGAYQNIKHLKGDPTISKVVGSLDGKEFTVAAYSDGGVACGDYQATILHYLDALRQSPVYGDLMKNVDYGPVSTEDGMIHHWVVAWQKGTDWKNFGCNLDPWLYQKTYVQPGKYYTNGEVIPDPEWKGLYPMNGAPFYPDEPPKFTYHNDKETQQVLVKCPVNVLISNQAGQRIGGLNDNQTVNEIPNAGFVEFPESDGTNLWYFMLPTGDKYTTRIVGTADGSFSLIARAGEGPIEDYGTQPIGKGLEAQVTFDPNNPAAALTLPDGKTVTPQGLETPNPTQIPIQGDEGFNWLIVIGIVGGGFIIVLIVLLARRKSR